MQIGRDHHAICIHRHRLQAKRGDASSRDSNGQRDPEQERYLSARYCDNPHVMAHNLQLIAKTRKSFLPTKENSKKVHFWLDKIGEHFEKSASSVGRMHLSEPWKPDATLSMHRMTLQSSEARSLQQTPIPAEKCSVLILQI